MEIKDISSINHDCRSSLIHVTTKDGELFFVNVSRSARKGDTLPQKQLATLIAKTLIKERGEA